MTLDFTNKNPNPIFSDYRLIDKDFQEGVLPKSSYQLEIERLEKEKAERQKNIQKTGYQSLKNAYSLNGTALSDIPSLPEFAQNAYKDYAKTPEWLDTLQVATPDEIEEWRKMGKMGIAETWAKKRKWEMIPFVGTTAETSLLVNNANTLRKIKNGEEVSEKDKELLVDYLRDLKEVEARGGHTLAGSAMDVMMSSIPYMCEFGAALALSPEGVGLGVAAKQLADIGAKRAARKALKKAITNNLMSGAEKKLSLSAAKNIYKDALKTSTKNTFKNVTENMTKKEIASTILKSTPKMLKSSFRAGAVITPQNFVRSVTDRQLSTGVYVSDAGDAVFCDSENIALSIMKAIGETTFEALTETAGSAFVPTIKYFAKPIRNKLPKGFIKAFDELVEKTYDMPSAKALKKFGYDGVIEEMGEEFLNRLLCQTFGINGLEEYTLDGFLNNVFYKDNPEQWAVEALAFAGMGGAGHVTANATIKGFKKAKEIADKKELERLADYSRTPEFDLEKVRHIKQPYSTEEFYLDQGLIRIKGSQSLAEQLLREKLEQNNISKADADEYLNLASENEIRDTLRVYQLNSKDVISLNNAKKIAKVSNKIFTQLKNSGLSNEDALYNSQIMTKAMTEMADLDNISIDKIHDMFKLNIQQLTTEQAQNVLKGGVAYQSAMYKSPKENFTDFYNQVFEKENEAKQNNSKVQKSYFEYKNGDTTLRVKHDAVNHSDKKHQLLPTEWEDVLNNISNIENAGISNKRFSNDNVALIKVATPSGKYGVTIQFANGTNQIATVFKSTDKGIDKWIEKGSANSSTSEPLTSRDNSHTVAVVGQNPNNIISYVKQKLNPKEFANQNIEKNFGQSVEDLQISFTDDIKNILAENEIDSDEFEIEDVRLYGSYTTGKNKDTSDLDVIVQYKGSMKEDAAFNIFNDENLTITDVNGVERKVDINPINRELSGTIDEHIERMHEIDGAYYQSANTAGAETSAEISDAKKEYEEKGTDSKYFKKWTNNSPVVMPEQSMNYDFKTGESVTVGGFHGTNQELEYFDYSKRGSVTDAKSAKKGFWFVNNKNTADSYADFASTEQPLNELQKELDKAERRQDWDKFDELTQQMEKIQSDLLGKSLAERGAKTYEVFVKFNNPYVFDAQDNTFMDIQSDINKVIELAKENGNDGVIITNLKDKPLEGEYGSQTSDIHYMAFNNNQIKSVDNRGTFDEGNPNIYYQSAMISGINPNQKIDVIDLSKNFANDSNLTKKDLSKYIKTLIGTKPLNTKDKKALASFVKTSKRIGKKDVYIPDHIAYSSKLDTNNSNERKTTVNNITDLIQNAILIDISKNTKKNSKPNVDNYLRFYIPVKINNDIFTVRIVAENNSSKNLFNILNADIYDVIIDKKMPTSAFIPAKTQSSMMKSTSNNIITNNSQNINPNQITIREMLNGVKDSDGKIYYQEEKNLLMTHNAKSDNLDAILESGNLIAPSFAITKKDYEVDALSKFGDVTFIRKPEKINFGSDNIYNRDIYSPRMPRPEYQLKDGTVIDSYEKDAQERLEKEKPERYKERFDKPTSERFKDAKKVMFTGYTPSGNRRYKPYTAENIIAQMKKEGLLSGENFDYGLSSLMSKFATKQKSMEELKESAKDGLYSSEQLNEDYENLKIEYEELGDKVAPLYWDKWSFYEFQSDVFFAIAKNKKKYLKDTYNIEVPADLEKEVKDFVTKAQTMPRSYFEAKPMREVSLNEFGYALARVGTLTENQKDKLKNVFNIDVIEYDDNIKDALEQVEKTSTYFQENDYNPLDSKRGFSTVRQDFDGTIKENLIVLLKGHADKSTLMHEFAHVYLMTLNQLAKIDAKAQMNLTTINKYLRYNGVEYTEQQHEKFAQGFEAYLKAGKAPTYKLKKAFEHFKSWLTSIYSRIETGDWQEELTLDDETKKVFDQILGDSAYSKKVEKAQELIEKARANANVLMNQEFASKKNIEPMTLTDRQKRYRDTAFDILYTALHNTKDENGNPYIKDKKELYMLFSTNKKMKQNNKGVFKRAEKLRFILEELDDPFSGGNYLPEWDEFFGYYDENEMYDSSLALAALDVIENKKYLYSESELGDFFTDEDLQHIEYECDYLINEFKNSKGDERDVAMLAYWDWIETVPDFVQEDFLNKWQLKTTEIERYENLDKFQQAKEDLILYAQRMKHQGSYSMQFAEFARQIIKRLDFLTIQDKGKMWAKFKDYDSFDAMLRDIDSIMDYAQTIEAVSDRKMMANEIDREVQQTIHEWKNGIKKTKYTYPANKLFERLRQIRKMSMEEIEDVYGAMVNEESEITYEADKVHDEDYYKTIEQMYIEFRMNGQYYNSSQFLANLLERIKTAKFTAKVARDEIDFERRMQQNNLIDECKAAVSSHKGKVSKLEKIYSAEFNLNSALEMMFNTTVKDKFTLDYLYSQKDAQVGADRDAVLKQIAKVFGLENKKFAEMRLFNIFVNMTKPEFKIHQRYSPDIKNGVYRVTHTDKETGKQITEQSIAIRPKGEGYKEWEDEEIELSRMQVLYYYIQAKNPISYKILTDMGDETHPPKGQFDKYEFNDLINQLTPQEKLMGDILQLAAEKYYDKLNRYHIEKYHTELGKVKGYFPRKIYSGQEKIYEPFNDYVQSTSNQRFQKQRTAGAGSRIKPANALEVLFTHIEQANTILIMGKQLDLMHRVFSSQDIQIAINATWGKKVADDFNQLITSNLYGGQASLLSNIEKECASMVNNVIKSQIFSKPQVGLKQVMSFMNYGVGDEYVSAGEWWLEFAKQTLTPTQWKKNIEYMMSIPYMKDRFSRGGSQEVLKEQLETRFYAKINLLDSVFSLPIRLGDISAIILGGKPYIDILIRKGYTEEQAQRIFIEKTVNDQQSGIPSTLSNWQRNAGKNPVSKMAFAYQNTPHQYFRTAYNSIVRFKQNPNLKTGLDMTKITFIYMYLFPLLFNMASSLSFAIATGQGDDDELWKDIWKSCIGGFTFIPYVGPLINSYWTGLHGEGIYGASDWFTTAANKLNVMARHASKGEITPMDIFLAVALFGEAKTGLPLTALGTELSGVGDIAQGKVAKGLLKVAGFTDYRAKKVTGEDE